MPNGMTFSGYACKNMEDKSYNLILFREATEQNAYTYKLPADLDNLNMEIIYQSAPANVAINGDSVTVKFSDERSFVWVRVGK